MKLLSLSTEWLYHHDQGLESFCRLAQEMGFDEFDFGPGVTEELLGDHDLSEFPISSFHAPMFLPLHEIRELASAETELGSLDPALRQESVEAVCRTLDLAHSLGVSAIAVHVGNANMPTASSKRLLTMYDEGLCFTDAYQTLIQHILQERAITVEPQLEAAIESLQVAGRHAADVGVQVGLENRCEQASMPSFADMTTLLNELTDYPIGLWLDVGHAVVQENLGFLPYTKWLDTFSGRIVGIHLHDVIGRNDHLAVGTGDIDWNAMIKRLPLEPVWVCEYSRRVAVDDVHKGLDLFRSILASTTPCC